MTYPQLIRRQLSEHQTLMASYQQAFKSGKKLEQKTKIWIELNELQIDLKSKEMAESVWLENWTIHCIIQSVPYSLAYRATCVLIHQISTPNFTTSKKTTLNNNFILKRLSITTSPISSGASLNLARFIRPVSAKKLLDSLQESLLWVYNCRAMPFTNRFLAVYAIIAAVAKWRKFIAEIYRLQSFIVQLKVQRSLTESVRCLEFQIGMFEREKLAESNWWNAGWCPACVQCVLGDLSTNVTLAGSIKLFQ